MTRRRVFLHALILLAVCAGSGCGYSLARGGSFPPNIRVIGVPTFTTLTPVSDVDRRVTDKVVSELLSRGRYKVERRETDVDAVLLGEITSITTAYAATNERRQATRYAVVLTAKVEVRELKTDKVLWSNPSMQFRDEYDSPAAATDPNAFFGQDANALDRLASNFARSLVSSILDAF